MWLIFTSIKYYKGFLSLDITSRWASKWKKWGSTSRMPMRGRIYYLNNNVHVQKKVDVAFGWGRTYGKRKR